MTGNPEEAGAVERTRPQPWIRVILFLVCASLIGLGVKQLGARLERDPRPAGWGRGLVQGALMPMALPTLLVGVDVSIYAERNTGVPYKLGYTMGVTACGAVFFGLMFARLARWRASGKGDQRR